MDMAEHSQKSSLLCLRRQEADSWGQKLIPGVKKLILGVCQELF